MRGEDTGFNFRVAVFVAARGGERDDRDLSARCVTAIGCASRAAARVTESLSAARGELRF